MRGSYSSCRKAAIENLVNQLDRCPGREKRRMNPRNTLKGKRLNEGKNEEGKLMILCSLPKETRRVLVPVIRNGTGM